MCAHLRREAEKKFPGEYPGTLHAAVGGFVFLRYICPAIVVPQKYGLLESTWAPALPAAKQLLTSAVAPGPHILRHLLLLSKVVQTVANGVLFGQKEAYMMVLNPFIEANQDRLREFLVAVSVSNSPASDKQCAGLALSKRSLIPTTWTNMGARTTLPC